MQHMLRIMKDLIKEGETTNGSPSPQIQRYIRNIELYLRHRQLVEFADWIHSNRLTINYKKSHYIVFHRKKLLPVNVLDIVLNDRILDRVQNTVFLGLNVNHNLNWSDHIKLQTAKISRINAILYLTRSNFPKNCLTLLYNSLVYPILSHCNIVWGRTYKSTLNQLFVAQKRCIRTINFRKRRDHTSLDFYSMKTFKLCDINNYFSLIFVFKFINGLISSPIAWEFATDDRFRNFNNLNLQVPLLVPPSINSHLIIIALLFGMIYPVQ